MVRRALSVLVLIAALGLPRPAVAQAPLGAWCQSPTLNVCLTLHSLSYVGTASATPGIFDFDFFATVSFWGNALPPSFVAFSMLLNIPFVSGSSFSSTTFSYTLPLVPGAQVDLFDRYTVTAPGASGPTTDVPVGWNPGVETQLTSANVKWWSYIPNTGGGSVSCAVPGSSSGGGTVPYCFDATVAPEPSTVVLLASGLLGLGIVAGWRRRKKQT